MQKVKTRGDHRAFCFHATSGPGGFPGPLVFACWLICAWLASAAGTVRPDDRPTVRRYDALPDEGTVGAIGVVLITTAPTIVAIPRADAETERADLHGRARTRAGRLAGQPPRGPRQYSPERRPEPLQRARHRLPRPITGSS